MRDPKKWHNLWESCFFVGTSRPTLEEKFRCLQGRNQRSPEDSDSGRLQPSLEPNKDDQ